MLGGAVGIQCSALDVVNDSVFFASAPYTLRDKFGIYTVDAMGCKVRGKAHPTDATYRSIRNRSQPNPLLGNVQFFERNLLFWGEKKGGKTIRGFSRKEKNINTDIPCGTSSRNPMFTGVCLLRLLSADVKYRSVLPVQRNTFNRRRLKNKLTIRFSLLKVLMEKRPRSSPEGGGGAADGAAKVRACLLRVRAGHPGRRRSLSL